MIKRPFSGSPRRGSLRPGDVVLALAILALLTLAAARLDRLSERQLSGWAAVADGDSLTLLGERIRLRGIDAPELGQECTADGRAYACGREARRRLARLAADVPVTCRGWERDRYGRVLARCRAGARDLGRAMVEAGWAIAYGDYGEAEAQARRAGRGLWAGTFEAPEAWRARRAMPAEARHGWAGRIVNLVRQMLRGGSS